MRIQFCGADRTVTGSSHLIEVNGLRIFLDMGIYQGARDEARRINQYLPADVKTADAIVLSHGHLDHCGKLPVAVRAGFKGPIYCTPATAEVTRIVLNDAAKIQQEDLDTLNRRELAPGEQPLQALYGPQDIPNVLRLFKTVPYAQKSTLGNDVWFTFFDAGHILGSAYVLLEWSEGNQKHNLLFTGDVGRYGTPIIRDPVPPPYPVEQLITESTYGNASHGPMDQVAPQFLDAVKFIIQRRSRLVIPSFALGRTQTVLWYMAKFIREKQIPCIPVYVDSPMGVEASNAYRKFIDTYDPETLKMIDGQDIFAVCGVKFASSQQESMQINRQAGPVVIIASSPTCEFGRVLHHLKRSVENPDDLIVFCGYIPPNTLGRRIQEGQKRVRIYDRWYDLRCQVRTINGLSAHADADELMRFLAPALGLQTQAYVVHGEVPQSEAFARRLLGAGVARATIPAMETSLDAYTAPLDATTSPPNRTDQD